MTPPGVKHAELRHANINFFFIRFVAAPPPRPRAAQLFRASPGTLSFLARTFIFIRC